MLISFRYWTQGYAECHHCRFPLCVQGRFVCVHNTSSEKDCSEESGQVNCYLEAVEQLVVGGV
jgi:hypothetical protein